MTDNRFVDYYEILQVSRNADLETIERVFRWLAKRYHPDNTNTGSSERFRALSEAYRVLTDPEQRARYDARYESGRKDQWNLFLEEPKSDVEEDRRIRAWVLAILHKARRLVASDPGIGVYELETGLEMAQGQLDYHLWYLKEKGWVMRTDSGKYAITVDGIDWISEREDLFRRDRLLGDGHSGETMEEAVSPGEDFAEGRAS